MHLYDYINEICYISEKSGINELRKAKDMFINNIDDAGIENDMYPYPVSGKVDYAALKPYRDDLNREGSEMSIILGKHAPEIFALYKDEKYDDAIALAKKYYDEMVADNTVPEGV